MLDGTPVLDIKPYLSSIPAAEIRRGWLDELRKRAAGPAANAVDLDAPQERVGAGHAKQAGRDVDFAGPCFDI